MPDFLQTAVSFVQGHAELFAILVIPITAALVGWLTNWLAIKMTFQPLEFIGIQFYGVKPVGWKGIGWSAIGWQGIIPSKAGEMAGKAVDMLVGKLINIEERFAQIEPQMVAEEMQPKLEALAKSVIDQTMKEELPLMWASMPNMRKRAIYRQASKEFPSAVEEIMEDLKVRIEEIWDIKAMVQDELMTDKALLNELFIRCGEDEFKFIERSGLYFGFLFGVIQAVIWYFFPLWWILPLGGLVVGYATNYLALKLIFEPVNPIKVGPLVFQGLFMKRQKEVSEEYARLVTSNILTTSKIFDAIMNGKGADKLMGIIERHVEDGINKTAGFNRTFIQLTAGTKKYEGIKEKACRRFVDEVPNTVQLVFDYAERALDLENTLRNRMTSLPPKDFIGFLRPVFQEDEFKLILVGAILGTIAGLIQLLFFVVG